jgi:hypothetical protein
MKTGFGNIAANVVFPIPPSPNRVAMIGLCPVGFDMDDKLIAIICIPPL